MNPAFIQQSPSVTWDSVKNDLFYTVFMGGKYNIKAEFTKLSIFKIK